MRYLSFFGVLMAFYFASSGVGVADESNNGKGPEQIVIQSNMDTDKVAKPAYLPHRAHQWLECDGCHHGKGPNGKKVNYSTGQKIEKCETCHNSKAGMPAQLSSLKLAGHALCMECHRKNDKQLTKCGTCHNKR